MSRKFLTPLVLPADPTAALEAATKQYVDSKATLEERSKGGGLVVNGTGILGNNTNFSACTFSLTDHPPGAAGGFLAPPNPGLLSLFNDEFIPINPANSYVLGCWARETNPAAVNPVFYSGIACFDASNLNVYPTYVSWQENTTTTLAANLNPGNTTIQLTSGANWYSGTVDYLSGVIVWNYVDALGFAWPTETYSRNVYLGLYDPPGSISGNTINLKAPWAGPAIPAGTAVSNSTAGGTYMYGGWVANATPTTWTWRDNKATPYSGLNYQTVPTTKFPQGTTKCKLVFLANAVAGSRTVFGGVIFEEYGHTHTAADVGAVPLTRSIGTTAPLTGGGDLSANRTLDISTFTSTVKGAVPPPTTLTGSFLKDDGTWAVPAGGGSSVSEVEVGPSDPIGTNALAELWYDTDALAPPTVNITAWTAVTFQNGWGNLGAGWQTAQYCKVGDIVYLRGVVVNPTPLTSTVLSTMFTLPVGFRSSAREILSVNTAGSAGYGDYQARLEIGVDGQCAVVIGVTAQNAYSYTSLSGLSFSVST